MDMKVGPIQSKCADLTVGELVSSPEAYEDQWFRGTFTRVDSPWLYYSTGDAIVRFEADCCPAISVLGLMYADDRSPVQPAEQPHLTIGRVYAERETVGVPVEDGEPADPFPHYYRTSLRDRIFRVDDVTSPGVWMDENGREEGSRLFNHANLPASAERMTRVGVEDFFAAKIEEPEEPEEPAYPRYFILNPEAHRDGFNDRCAYIRADSPSNVVRITKSGKIMDDDLAVDAAEWSLHDLERATDPEFGFNPIFGYPRLVEVNAERALSYLSDVPLFRAGNLVRVAFNPGSRFDHTWGFDNSWASGMEHCVGAVFTVRMQTESGVEFEERAHAGYMDFPPQVLERV